MSVWEKKREERNKEKKSSNTHSQTHIYTPTCPECNSLKTWKDGFWYYQGKPIQRYLCRNCGLRFSNNGFKECQTNNGCQICVLDEMKNLVAEQTKTKVLQENKNKIKSQLVNFAWQMKKEGYAESTITRNVRQLKTLTKRGGNLLDPESIKRVIAQQENWKPTTKEHAVTAYTSYLKTLGKKWKKPRYKRIRKLPFIPQEQEVNDLISGCNRKTSAFLRLLKETGMRSGEAWQLEWTDFNFEHRTVSVTPEKGSNPRALPLSTELIAMLKGLSNTSNNIFTGSLRHFRRNFRKQRKRVVEKLKNPRIDHISFHTLRHFKATMEYHKTKDILHVKQILGHRSINSTLLYTQLVNFKETDYHVRVASDIKEACELVKTGFQYVTGEYVDGGKIFRKPK